MFGKPLLSGFLNVFLTVLIPVLTNINTNGKLTLMAVNRPNGAAINMLNINTYEIKIRNDWWWSGSFYRCRSPYCGPY